MQIIAIQTADDAVNRMPRSAVSALHSEGPPFRWAPFSAICSSDNLRLGIRLGLGLGSVVWLWQYQELFPATTTNDGFQNGGPFGMAALRNGGPEPDQRVFDT